MFVRGQVIATDPQNFDQATWTNTSHQFTGVSGLDGQCIESIYHPSNTSYCTFVSCTSGGGGTCNRCGGCTPVVIDTRGAGFYFTDVAHGVKFPYLGTPIQTAWTLPDSGSGFLALPTADGSVNSLEQLFGNTDGFPNGFAKLASYDDNADGIIDAKDRILSFSGCMRGCEPERHL